MELPNNTKLTAVDNRTVVDKVIQVITDAIISGEFKAGTRLPNEYELVEQLQVSRNSIREAMKILSAMGIVEVKRGDGTYVCSQMSPSIFDTVIYSMIYDVSTTENLVELRKILDEATVRLVSDRINEEQLAELYANVDRMEQCIRRADMEEAQKLDMEFHMKMVEYTNNPLFIRIVKGVYTIFERSITDKMKKDQNDSQAAYYHRNMLHCIETKDRANIENVVSDSLKSLFN